MRISALKMAPNQKNVQHEVLGNFEGYNFDVLSFFIRGRFQPQNAQNRTAVLGPLVIRVRLCWERFGRDFESFSFTESPASSYIDEVTAD